MTATILIVEDESIIALDIKKSLESAGYCVVGVAASPAQALEQVVRHKTDLVLMDIRLGGEDGVETAHRMRTQFHLPVVFLTAHADETTLQRAKATEPFGYVLKPFDDRVLITTIEIALIRHRAEAAMQVALEKEREFTELKSRFVSIVSHEFRNPLNVILFSSELLDQYSDQFSQQKQRLYLNRIQSSVRQMSQLLDDVLTVGAVEAGSLYCCPQRIDLVEFCHDVIEEMKLGLGPHHAIVLNVNGQYCEPTGQTQTASSATLILLDDRLLRHILTNLLSNAIKYSPDGGNIRVDVGCAEDTVILKIQDEGIGIPALDQGQLFDSFYRASNVKTISGTGLGLSIVKQCVDLQGGEISVISEVGVGSTFTVTLPLSRE